MVLPDGDLGTAQEDVLTRSGLGLLLVHLDLDDIAGVLNDLGDEGLVATSDLTQNSLHEICKASVHPVLPEDTGTKSRKERCRL